MIHFIMIIYSIEKFLILTLFTSSIYSADFTPTPMTISVQPQLEYKFDDSPLEIPFTLTGKSGAIWLVINTHGQAENIANVRNGHLGWHYVNKIDTTIYISDRFERQPGENIITWDGKDENGNKAEPGTYNYYFWGYDDKSDRELACKFIIMGYSYWYQAAQIYEKGSDGLPLSNPLIMGCTSFFFSRDAEESYKRTGTQYKWTIGSTPDDVSLIQTTFCKMYYPKTYTQSAEGFQAYAGSVFDPKDYNLFYNVSIKTIKKENEWGIFSQAISTVFKWDFVSGGEAVRHQEWGGWDNILWEDRSSGMKYYPTCVNDDNYIYVTSPSISWPDEWNKLKCIRYDGEIVFDKQFHEWYDPDKPYTPNASIDKMYSRTRNNWLLVSNFSCIHQMINTSRLFNDPDDETDMVVFTNRNGDYFMDNGWKEGLDWPWFCVPHISIDESMENSIWKNSVCIDSNNFNLIFIRNYGISSFGVSTQDGTGIGYMNFADDINSLDVNKGGGQLCDNGSSYDGLYISDKNWEEYATYYMAFDSAHGLITNNPAVQEQNPLQFKVSQNTPNPFNPSTTISFSIPEKSNVSIDIYNITGQKIKTLINGSMSAGEHSVKWDANGRSAGVYFYKVKAGKFEKTMRMTLVR